MTSPPFINENAKTEDELWVIPEKSLFRTHLPRPHHAVIHLVLAFSMFILALMIAIFYAER